MDAGTIEEFGRLDGPANIGGVETKPGGKVFAIVVDITNDHWDFMMGINLTGLFGSFCPKLVRDNKPIGMCQAVG